jgi:hypothetical protein
MLEPAMVMMVLVFMVVPVVMIVVVNVPAVGEEVRLDIEDAVEIESLAVEDLIEGNFRPFGFVQLGVGVDTADTRLDIA